MLCADWSSGAQTKNAKVDQKKSGLGQVTYFYYFSTPYYICGMAERTNVKFGA